MKYKIGVFGSAEGDFEKILNIAHQLGEELGKRNLIIISGASTGIPYEISLSAYKNGAEIWGFSAAVDIESQIKITSGLDNSIFTKLVYIPKEYEFVDDKLVCRKYRNVTSTATCDAGIIISGRWGTLNEFTNLYDFGKVIGVLTGTGGIADEIEQLSKKIAKQSGARLFFNTDPKYLVDSILKELQNVNI